MSHPSEQTYDPDSVTAQLATLIAQQQANKDAVMARFDRQDADLAAIKEQTVKTNGRVTVLEMWKETTAAKVSVVVAVCGLIGGFIGWLVPVLLTLLDRS